MIYRIIDKSRLENIMGEINNAIAIQMGLIA